MKVTSLAEVWIEIFVVRMHRYIMQSLPLRKCGLKFIFIAIPHFRDTVTSLAEVWIEIKVDWEMQNEITVTSLAEVWIEIMFCCVNPNCNLVTSLAEVWIEIW